MIFIIGGNGLSGSAIVRYLRTKDIDFEIIQKENKKDFFGKKCDLLIFANGNALKYRADEDPLFDFDASLRSVSEYIHKIDYDFFIHLSSVNVYDDTSSQNSTKESTVIDTSKLSNYGFHKFLAEELVKHFCKNYLIFRMPGLVGPGLKKNPAFDFIDKNKDVMVSANSIHNYIHTDFMARCIFKIFDMGIKNEIFNLASQNSIQLDSLRRLIGYDTKYTNSAKDTLQNYQVNTTKIQQHITLSSSEEAIKIYFKQLNTFQNI